MRSVFIKSLNAQKCLFEYLREPRESERYCAEVTHSDTQYYSQYNNQFTIYNVRNLMLEFVGSSVSGLECRYSGSASARGATPKAAVDSVKIFCDLYDLEGKDVRVHGEVE